MRVFQGDTAALVSPKNDGEVSAELVDSDGASYGGTINADDNWQFALNTEAYTIPAGQYFVNVPYVVETVDSDGERCVTAQGSFNIWANPKYPKGDDDLRDELNLVKNALKEVSADAIASMSGFEQSVSLVRRDALRKQKAELVSQINTRERFARQAAMAAMSEDV